jgi:hypothetical protein
MRCEVVNAVFPRLIIISSAAEVSVISSATAAASVFATLYLTT